VARRVAVLTIANFPARSAGIATRTRGGRTGRRTDPAPSLRSELARSLQCERSSGQRPGRPQRPDGSGTRWQLVRRTLQRPSRDPQTQSGRDTGRRAPTRLYGRRARPCRPNGPQRSEQVARHVELRTDDEFAFIEAFAPGFCESHGLEEKPERPAGRGTAGARAILRERQSCTCANCHPDRAPGAAQERRSPDYRRTCATAATTWPTSSGRRST